ncbi:hypothetical protein P5815_03200 [Bacillus cereus]|uniref:AbiJ-NTD4 domain-containing protein n=1 Tax=Bacillus TaxID=1386 RepID=UPI000278F727|nr:MULTISPECIES: hypothetical protein [Bacillus cereus group]QQP81837.1 hypothetical protein JI729_10970 [Bacillus sp. TK-2]EJQ07374.1 hypothetical protein IE1_03236 [Bacillus cereus BAG3O-2]EJQ27566.1 hypothetical protein IE7_02101 [Bacillus cereus BAG4O-1]MBJ7951437.1 hypothetical protein [Bacillus cereus]MBX9155658.1 hypothetical protein [Bacillus cereus]
MKFSERMGFVSVNQLIQIDSMNEPLRNGLWNSFYTFIWRTEYKKHKNSRSSMSGKEGLKNLNTIAGALWYDFFKLPLSKIPSNLDNFFKYVENQYFAAEWYQAYDFIEYIAQSFPFLDEFESFKKECNRILEQEKSAYRFTNNTLTQITTEQEIESIEKAINSKGTKAFISMHIEQALRLMADRNNPDYINSIKESISAVESICKVIIEDEKGTLGQALNKLEQKGIVIQDALKEGFKRIYWYTSDNDGIRHAHKDVPNVSYEDAQFMLITCSAFCNYLTEKANKAGIDIS